MKFLNWSKAALAGLISTTSPSSAAAAAARTAGSKVPQSMISSISGSFSSSDETILTVDQDGTVTGVSEGSAAVTVTLEQNPNVTASVKIIVDDADAGTGIFFTGSAPDRLQAFESCTIEATAYNDGADTGTPILYRFSGAAAGSYSAVQTGNQAKITCYGFSETPLTVTASADMYGSQEITIKLEGM